MMVPSQQTLHSILTALVLFQRVGAWTTTSNSQQALLLGRPAHLSSSLSRLLPSRPTTEAPQLLLFASADSDSVVAEDVAASDETTTPPTITVDIVPQLKYRELQWELRNHGLPTAGTTAQLRDRLRKQISGEYHKFDGAAGTEDVCVVVNDEGLLENDCIDQEKTVC